MQAVKTLLTSFKEKGSPRAKAPYYTFTSEAELKYLTHILVIVSLSIL